MTILTSMNHEILLDPWFIKADIKSVEHKMYSPNALELENNQMFGFVNAGESEEKELWKNIYDQNQKHYSFFVPSPASFDDINTKWEYKIWLKLPAFPIWIRKAAGITPKRYSITPKNIIPHWSPEQLMDMDVGILKTTYGPEGKNAPGTMLLNLPDVNFYFCFTAEMKGPLSCWMPVGNQFCINPTGVNINCAAVKLYAKWKETTAFIPNMSNVYSDNGNLCTGPMVTPMSAMSYAATPLQGLSNWLAAYFQQKINADLCGTPWYTLCKNLVEAGNQTLTASEAETEKWVKKSNALNKGETAGYDKIVAPAF